MSYDRQRPQVHRVSVPGLWWKVFTAGLAAVLVGGFVLLLSVRWYIRSSAQDAYTDLKERSKQIPNSWIGQTLNPELRPKEVTPKK